MSDSNELRWEDAKRVNEVLAGLNLFFNFGQGPTGFLWALNFFGEKGTPEDSVVVNIHLEQDSVVVSHLHPALAKEERLFKDLLRINVALPLAKVGVSDTGQIVVWGHIPLHLLAPDLLRAVFGAVVGAVHQIRRLTASPETTH